MRTLQNESRTAGTHTSAPTTALLRYSRPLRRAHDRRRGAGGPRRVRASFSRVAAFVRYSGDPFDDASVLYDGGRQSASGDKTAELFVEAGPAYNQRAASIRMRSTSRTSPRTFRRTLRLSAFVAPSRTAAISAPASSWTTSTASKLMSVRAVDYRYQVPRTLSPFPCFVGASRYDLATPAYGLYYGVGLQWRDIRPALGCGRGRAHGEEGGARPPAPGRPAVTPAARQLLHDQESCRCR